MHGAKAFKEFIDKKNSRVPEFLETVSDQQEHSKVEGEDAKDKKKSRSISTQHSQFGSSQNYVFWQKDSSCLRTRFWQEQRRKTMTPFLADNFN